MIKGTTSTGFNFEVEDERLDDYELLEVLSDIDDGEYSKVTKMVNLLLGKEQKDALKDHLKALEGRTSAHSVIREVMEIFESCNAGKNS